jgi:tRNA(Arg) A34 adenosine deaminase TadA
LNYKQFAINLAKKVEGRYRVSALILDKQDRVISYGLNSYEKTHPIQKKYSKLCNNDNRIYLHAEVASLIKSKNKGYKIYICRIDNSGNTCLAKPCPICELAIKEHGSIKIIEYTI